MAVLIALEAWAAAQAFHTLSEIDSGAYHLAIGLNVLPAGWFLLGFRRAGVLAAVLLAATLVPYQAVLGLRSLRLQAEAGRVVAYVYQYKLETGEYPADLSGYRFADTALKGHYHYGVDNPYWGGFIVSYWVGTPCTSHWYCPGQGWRYHPD